MIETWIVVLQYSDLSGIISCFGPYATPEEAEAAVEKLRLEPFMQPGVWRVERCILFADDVRAAPGPAAAGPAAPTTAPEERP